MDSMSIARTAQRIQGEYLEMPGLNLTLEQARRLWNLDETACVAILDTLVDLQFLRKTTRGSYIRREAAA